MYLAFLYKENHRHYCVCYVPAVVFVCSFCGQIHTSAQNRAGRNLLWQL